MTRGILIVDDNAALVEVVRSLLVTNGGSHVTADAAYSFFSAVERLQQNHYKLVVLDLNLPDSPLDTTISELDRIKELCGEGTKLIVMTGHSIASDEVLSKGVDQVVYKGEPELVTKLIAAFKSVI